jgi:ferric-dicitrate binding protein FerR (iron transport regulator)
MSLQEAKQFVAHFVTGDYTPVEYATFLQWLRDATVDEMNTIADEHEVLHESWLLPANGPSPLWVAELEGKLDAVSEESASKEKSGWGEAVPVRSIGRFPRRRVWVAAASVIVVLSVGGLWYTRHHSDNEVGHEKSNISSKGTNDSNDKGLASLSQIIRTPRGIIQKELVLADGSKVWLNAASVLKYPVAFSGPERVVELSGEGYFEVAKDPAMPFRVRIKDAEVEVLGTHFNIMAYENDKVSKTTLIDGAVTLVDRSAGVEDRSEQQELKPGQQAVMVYPSPGVHGKNEENINIVTIADPSSVIAWKDGLLQFDSADLSTVMHTVERYYDVDIQFDQGMSGKVFTGGFARQDKLEHVLKILTSFYALHYKMDGKTVTVIH